VCFFTDSKLEGGGFVSDRGHLGTEIASEA
jgi:hypothetical protein